MGVGFGSGGGAGDVTGSEKDNAETQRRQRFLGEEKDSGINPACGKRGAATQRKMAT